MSLKTLQNRYNMYVEKFILNNFIVMMENFTHT